MSGDHDTAYKQLFSHPEFVQQLMEGFAPVAISQRLDYATLTRHPGSYITPALKERLEDMVWSVKLLPDNAHPANEPLTIYLYLLLEFQSSVDAAMPLRMLQYTAAFYLQLIKEQSLTPGTDKLPPVFPLVLYNGDARWKAARSVAELMPPMPQELARYQPQLHYYLIDEKRLPDATLEQRNDPLSGIFSMEKADNSQQLHAAAVSLIRKAKAHPARDRIERMLIDWVKFYLSRQNYDFEPSAINQLEELPTMLDINKELQDKKQEGILQGLLQGREQGAYEGRCEAARGMLALGQLTDEQIAAISNLSLEQVQALKQELH